MKEQWLVNLYKKYCEYQIERQTKNDLMGIHDIGRSFDDFMNWLEYELKRQERQE